MKLETSYDMTNVDPRLCALLFLILLFSPIAYIVVPYLLLLPMAVPITALPIGALGMFLYWLVQRE